MWIFLPFVPCVYSHAFRFGVPRHFRDNDFRQGRGNLLVLLISRVHFRFMAAGGWNLTHTWLSDAIMARNWPLIQELLELLLMCPVDVERLKTNNCPKLIKGLSKESNNESRYHM
jgi:hypothetical protein